MDVSTHSTVHFEAAEESFDVGRTGRGVTQSDSL